MGKDDVQTSSLDEETDAKLLLKIFHASGTVQDHLAGKTLMMKL